MEAGDILVVPHGDAYYLAEPTPGPASYSEADAVEFFRKMVAGKLPSIVPEGGGGADRTEFICGFLGCDVRPFNPILSALPRVIHVRRAARPADRMSHLVAFALDELRERRQGGQGVLLRLSELMFVEVVRRCLETLPDAHAGWLAGLRDPVVGRALACLHAEPARRWTLDALAAQAGASRSVLAQRFHELVGQPPMQYLTSWRMQLATRLLDDKEAKVCAVAEAVGYDSEAAFSRAFKKAVGTAPSRWRVSSRDATDE
jgi:AraC-like DNA-binding protein